MSFNIVDWAIKQSDLDRTTRLVLITLASYANRKTGQCNPSQKKLAKTVGLKSSSLNTHLRILEEKGLIIRRRQYDPATGAARATQYWFPEGGTKSSDDVGRK